MSTRIEKIIYASRWLLAPIYLGLALGLLLYGVRFVAELWHLFQDVLTVSDEKMLLSVLHLIEIAMLANFMIMVIIGGFALFVKQLRGEAAQLQWLDHIDPGVLKLKMSMSLLGVSSVHLLEAFVNAASVTTETLTKLIVIHLVFVASTVAIAFVNRIGRRVPKVDH